MKKIISKHKFKRILENPRTVQKVRVDYRLIDNNIEFNLEVLLELGDYQYKKFQGEFYRSKYFSDNRYAPLTECLLSEFPIKTIKLETREKLFDGLETIRKRFKV
jgi:hypothetical protein